MNNQHHASIPASQASFIQRRRSRNALSFSSAVNSNGSTQKTLKHRKTFKSSTRSDSVISEDVESEFDGVSDDWLIRRTAEMLGSNSQEKKRFSISYDATPDERELSSVSINESSVGSSVTSSVSYQQDTIDAFMQNIALSNSITNILDDNSYKAQQIRSESLAFKEFILLSAKPSSISKTLDEVCNSKTHQTLDGESPLRSCGSRYLSPFSLSLSSCQESNSGVVADSMKRYPFCQENSKGAATSKEYALTKFCFPQESIRMRLIPRCGLKGAKRLGWLGRSSDKFQILSFTNENGKMTRGISITTTDEMFTSSLMSGGEESGQTSRASSTRIVEFLITFRQLNFSASLVQRWWKKMKNKIMGNCNSSMKKEDERLEGKDKICKEDVSVFLRWFKDRRERNEQTSQIYLPPSWSQNNSKNHTYENPLENKELRLGPAKRSYTMNMVHSSSSIKELYSIPSTSMPVEEKALGAKSDKNNWLQKMPFRRHRLLSDATLSDATLSDATLSTTNTDDKSSSSLPAQLMQAHQSQDGLNMSWKIIPDSSGVHPSDYKENVRGDECSEWARVRGREAYKNMQDFGRDEVCLIERCFIMIGTIPGEEALAFRVLRNLMNCECSRSNYNEARDTISPDDVFLWMDIMSSIQSKAVVPIHLQSVSYPSNPYDHVYNKRQLLHVEFEKEHISPVKIPLPLPQIAGEWGFARLLLGIGSISFMKIIKLLLMERSILVIGNSCEEVTACALCLLEIIKPFEWVCTFLPSLPRSLMDFLNSPVPFIAGLVVSDEMECNRVLKDPIIQQAILDGMSIVNLSENVFLETQEIMIIPFLSTPSHLRIRLQSLVERMTANANISSVKEQKRFFPLQEFIQNGFESRDTLTLCAAKTAIHNYLQSITGSLLYTNTPWQSYVQVNDVTEEIEFKPCLLIKEQKTETEFREFVVHTQLFAAYVESHLNLGTTLTASYKGRAAKKIAHWFYNTWKKRKNRSLQQ